MLRAHVGLGYVEMFILHSILAGLHFLGLRLSFSFVLGRVILGLAEALRHHVALSDLVFQ